MSRGSNPIFRSLAAWKASRSGGHGARARQIKSSTRGRTRPEVLETRVLQHSEALDFTHDEVTLNVLLATNGSADPRLLHSGPIGLPPRQVIDLSHPGALYSWDAKLLAEDSNEGVGHCPTPPSLQMPEPWRYEERWSCSAENQGGHARFQV